MFSASKNKIVKRRSFGCSFRRLNLSASSGSRNLSGRASDPSNVKVVVRVRPQNQREQSANNRCVVHVPDETLLVFDPEEESEDFFFQGRKQQQRDLLKRACKNKSFCFDRVFDGESTNQNVFEECALPIVDGLLNGFNCSVFAYGATGAGKTHTMLGNSENPGITFLIVMELFDRINQLENKTCDLSVSYLEVYNETIKDLICPTKDLQIREDNSTARIIGLSVHKPKDAKNLLDLLEFGNKNRTQHPTDANKESSRSHAVFQVFIKLTDKVVGVSESVKFAKMSLVDLAGSERANVIQGRDKSRLREGANINQSLLALGSCINALADKKKANHIPYRNSKLTRILKDSLGGNCQTVMIAAVSPSLASYDDTYNTLNYANRAKQIKIQLKRNAVHVDAHISKHKKIMEALQKENAALKHKLKTYETATSIATNSNCCQTSFVEEAAAPYTFVSTPRKGAEPRGEVPSEDDSVEFMSKMDELWAEKMRLQIKILSLESDGALLQRKVQWRESLHRHINTVTWDQEKLARSSTKLNSMLQGSQMKRKYLGHTKSKAEGRLLVVDTKMTELLSEYPHSDTPFCKLYLSYKHQEEEKTMLLKLMEHTYRFADSQDKACQSVMRFSEDTLNQLQDHQLLLRGYQHLTPDLERNFQALISELHHRKEVNWPDEGRATQNVELQQSLFLPSVRSIIDSQGPLTSHCTSTPGPSKSEAPLANYLSPDCIGEHSYIPIGSLPPSPSSASGLDFNTGGVSPVMSRNKCGTPHPGRLNLIGEDPVRRSLEETFSLSSKKAFSRLNTTYSPNIANNNTQNSDTPRPIAFSRELVLELPQTSELNRTVNVERDLKQFKFAIPSVLTSVSKLRKMSSSMLVNPVAPMVKPQEPKRSIPGLRKMPTSRTPLREKVAPPAISKTTSGKKWLTGAALRSKLGQPKENIPLGSRAAHRLGGLQKSQSTSNLTGQGKPKL